MTSLRLILLPICCLRELFPDQCKTYLLKENCFVYCFSTDSPLSTRILSQAVYCVNFMESGTQLQKQQHGGNSHFCWHSDTRRRAVHASAARRDIQFSQLVMLRAMRGGDGASVSGGTVSRWPLRLLCGNPLGCELPLCQNEHKTFDFTYYLCFSYSVCCEFPPLSKCTFLILCSVRAFLHVLFVYFAIFGVVQLVRIIVPWKGVCFSGSLSSPVILRVVLVPFRPVRAHYRKAIPCITN